MRHMDVKAITTRGNSQSLGLRLNSEPFKPWKKKMPFINSQRLLHKLIKRSKEQHQWNGFGRTQSQKNYLMQAVKRQLFNVGDG